MKFDNDKKKSTEKNVSPQSALDAYFDDMFGTTEEDPLKTLESQDKSLKFDNEPFNQKKSYKKTDQCLDLQPKRKNVVQHSLKQQYDQPEVLINNLSSLIIPAAFPKLAPSEPKTKLDLKQPEQKIKQKIDAKTALQLLNKKKSKLSIAQKKRLKEKLKSLAHVKQGVDLVKSSPKKALKIEPKLDEIVTKPAIKPPTKENIETVDSTVLVEAQSYSEPDAEKNNLPDWANKRFECLLFSVAGLKLAVPLISLGAIYKIEKNFIPLVGRANWFMGLYHHLDRNVRVIDTAQWVMPERCSEEVRAEYKFIIRLGGNDWGIACDAVYQSIQLNPDQIKWRSQRTKRAWLLGTVIDHMCALIDVDTLSATLEQQAAKNPSIFLN